MEAGKYEGDRINYSYNNSTVESGRNPSRVILSPFLMLLYPSLLYLRVWVLSYNPASFTMLSPDSLLGFLGANPNRNVHKSAPTPKFDIDCYLCFIRDIHFPN